MIDVKEQVAAAIARAQTDLEQALSDLEKLPAFDPGAVSFTAHALNNYLTVVGATVQLLLLHLKDHSDPQIRIWMEGLNHATNLMSHAVNQLMSTPGATDVKLRFEKVDLPILVRRGCDYYQRVADRKQIQVICGPTVDVPLVRADRVAVAAVLDNLLSNAVKYSPHGKRIWVQVHGEKTSAVCSIQDEGPGLREEEQARLFQRGVRLSPVPTGGEPTVGYGLAVAKELTEKLGGEIWCVSTPGQGACFSFRLPLYQEEEHEPGKNL